MPVTQYQRRRLRAATLLAFALVLSEVVIQRSPAARAAFPGTNGLIAFGGDGGLFVARPDGTQSRAVTSTQTGWSDTEPGWSSDGRRIAFSRSNDLWLVNADGSGLRQLTSRPEIETEPAWSPDGTRIVFSSERSGNRDIWVIDADGANARQLTTALAPDVDPQWSPDGTLIAYSRSVDGAPEVRTIAPDGTGDRRLAAGACPDWAPSGDRIVYGRPDPQNGPSHDVVVANRDGTGERVLRDVNVPYPAVLCTFSWSPDGTQIAYSYFSAGRSSSFVAFLDAASGADLGAWDMPSGWPDWGVQPADGSPPPTTAPPGDTVVRRAGSDRIGTAIAVSQGSFAAGEAQSSVITRADAYPDGLAGAPLAVRVGGPMLLTGRDGLDPRVEAELRRVRPAPGRVHLLGGLAALSGDVDSRLRALGYEVVRHAGADRYETAVQVARALGNPDRVVLARGESFADALAAGPAAASVGGAVLLTASSSLPPSTAGYISVYRPTRYAVGGGAAAADPGAEAIVGADRFDTSVRVARRFFGSPVRVGLASGLAFPDALAGGADMGTRGPLLLTAPDRLSTVVADYLSSNRGAIQTVVVYGGPAAVSDAAAEDARAAIS